MSGTIRISSKGTAVRDFIIIRLAKYIEKLGRLFPSIEKMLCGYWMISYKLLTMEPRPTETNTLASW
jgi:hypothetical protein